MYHSKKDFLAIEQADPTRRVIQTDFAPMQISQNTTG